MENYQKRLAKAGLALRAHQQVGVEKALAWRREGHGGIVADEMGLGKTCEAIAIVYQLITESKQRPHLIVSPLSVIDHWENELKRFGLDELKVVKLLGNCEERAKICERLKNSDDWNVLLTTYEFILAEKGFISRMRWTLLIVDEAQRMKNIDSQIHGVVERLQVDWILLMTGTPVQNNIRELYSLLCLIDRKHYPIKGCDEFVEKYNRINDDKVLEELRKILSKYMIRRLKGEILLDIPHCSQVTLYHGLSAVQKQLYKAILSKNSEMLLKLVGNNNNDEKSASKNSRSVLMGVMMQLRKCALHPYLFDGLEPEPFEEGEHLATASGKMMLLRRLLEYLKAQKHRVLLFSQMRRMLDIVQDYFNFRGWAYERIDGHVRAVDRFEAVNSFQSSNSDIFCFLLSTRAGGLGLTLTGADTVVFIDADFNPQNDIQAAARCHRIGQSKHVKIIRLVTKNTVEDLIECYASRKLHMTNRIMYSDELIQNEKLTAVELERMIMHGLKHLSDDEQDMLNAASSMSDRELEQIIGQTDESGNWVEKKGDEKKEAIPKESGETSAVEVENSDKIERESDEVDSTNGGDEIPNMYVFEGHDYKKEREALLKIVAENDKDNKELAGISVQNARIRNVLHLKQGIKEEDGETKQSESARRLEEVKIERARKAAERKAKFWADNGYVSTNLPLPSVANNDENDSGDLLLDSEALDGTTDRNSNREDGERMPTETAENIRRCSADSDSLDDQNSNDDEDESYYGPYYVNGDVTKPLRADGDRCKHALIVHAIDNSGVFGNGGVFTALRKKDSRIPEAYELAAKMNDLYLGHAHLIANVGESVEREDVSEDSGGVCLGKQTTTAQQNNELNGGKNAKSWTRRQSVVLLVVQQKKFRIFTNERLFAESLQRLCAYATRVNARSVHLPLLDNQMPGKNWYSVKRLIKKRLTDKRIHTYFYYYRRPTPPTKPQQDVNQKHQDRERKQQHSRDKRQNNRGNSNKVDGSHLEDRRRKDGRKRRMNSSEYDGGEGTSKNYTPKKRNEMRTRCKDNDDDDDESEVIDRELDAQEGDEVEEIVDSEEERAEEMEENEFESKEQDVDGSSSDENDDYVGCSAAIRRRMRKIFERYVFWIGELCENERQKYASLIEKYGGDAITEQEQIELANVALWDDSEGEANSEVMRKLKESLPEKCVIISKDWIDQCQRVGKLIDQRAFLFTA